MTEQATPNTPDREFLSGVLHLFVLSSFALAQPLYDLLGRNPEFFVVRRSTPTSIILFVLTLSLLGPALAALIEWVAKLISRRVWKGVHGLFLTVLTTFILLPILKKLDHLPDVVILAGAIILGLGLAWACLRYSQVRFFVTALSPGILIFPFLFIFHSQVQKLVFPKAETNRPKQALKANTTVVMIVFDEFRSTALMDRQRQIDSIRFPNFASLARGSTWYRNASTNSPATERAVTAILTGLRPDLKRLPMAADYPHSLFTFLGGSYRLKVVEPITSLCPEELCQDGGAPPLTARMKSLFMDLSAIYLHIVLPPRMSSRLPVVTQSWDHFWSQDKSKESTGWKESARELWHRPAVQFGDFLNEIDTSDQPTLYFLHIALPHVPWRFLPSGKTYADSALKVPGLNFKTEVWRDNKWLVIRGEQRFLLQVGYVDLLLGKLIARLKEQNVYDRSLLVILADHGVSFRPGQKRRKAENGNYQDIMPIPLFIKLPFQKTGQISDRNVQSIDILPTVADAIGAKLPWPVDGASILNSSSPQPSEKIIYGTRSAEDDIHVDASFPEKYSALADRIAIFGTGSDPNALFRIGPEPELIGKQVRDFPVSEESATSVDLNDSPELFAGYDHNSDFVPAFISGRVNLGGDAPKGNLDVAIAMNGVIEAATRTFKNQEGESWSALTGEPEGVNFAALIPDSSFKDGKNKLDLYVISRDANGQPSLNPIKINSSVAYSLSGSGDSLAITSSNGQTYRVVPGTVRGSVSIRQIGNTYSITGWAANLKKAEPADEVVFFRDGKGVYSSRVTVSRPDVAKYFNLPNLQNSGFVLTIPMYIFEGEGNAKIRVLAISRGGVASELKNPDD